MEEEAQQAGVAAVRVAKLEVLMEVAARVAEFNSVGNVWPDQLDRGHVAGIHNQVLLVRQIPAAAYHF